MNTVPANAKAFGKPSGLIAKPSETKQVPPKAKVKERAKRGHARQAPSLSGPLMNMSIDQDETSAGEEAHVFQTWMSEDPADERPSSRAESRVEARGYQVRELGADCLH
jgi:hypothetical protein